MRIMGGNLQHVVDSFDLKKQGDRDYVAGFIDKQVAPALCTFVGASVDSDRIEWDGICGCFNVERPIGLKLYPESGHAF
jgi:hypothetical protein